jgi:phytoene/squalene synthetase
MKPDMTGSDLLAASITRAASKQTDYTIRFLVDPERAADAYRAYAYFRWVDDRLDQVGADQTESLAFIDRQKRLLDACYQGEALIGLGQEEAMLVDLLRGDRAAASGLRTYFYKMMAVMGFDAERRGRLISLAELNEYTNCLAAAVTEALHYFIGHDCPPPRSAARYEAATAAHVVHMLRDTLEDVEAGYYNIPREFLESYGITPQAVSSEPYRLWVEKRVKLARTCLEGGKDYLAQVKHRRCRLAGYAYLARFDGVLAAIEREGYPLRAAYPECKRLGAGLKMLWSAYSMALLGYRQRPAAHMLSPR